MFNKVFHSVFTQKSLFNLGLAVTVGLMTSSAAPLWAKSLDNAELKEQTPTSNTNRTTLLEGGIYLYGQSSEPDEIGKEYFVFEVNSGEVRGAVYYPHSEFACVSGTVNSQQMNLTLTDPFTGTPHDYAIALQDQSLMASASSQAPGSFVELEGYHSVGEVSNNDLRMLNECHAN